MKKLDVEKLPVAAPPFAGPETICMRKALASFPQIKLTAEQARRQVIMHLESARSNDLACSHKDEMERWQIMIRLAAVREDFLSHKATDSE